MLRGFVERGSHGNVYSHTTVYLPSVGYGLPTGWIHLTLPNSHRDETRWYQDGQTGEADDSHWDLFGAVHRTGVDYSRLFVLRELQL